MMDVNQLDLDYLPKLPQNKMMGIGIIGAGEIVREAHLPAYKLAGFHVVALSDLIKERAKTLAQQFEISNVYANAEQVINDPEVKIVDIAIPAQFQPEMVEMAAKAGKHVLCQKPLGDTLASARKIVKLCKTYKIKGAVNQQMRWAPGIKASKTIIDRGWLGDLTQATIQVNVHTPFEGWSFLKEIDTLEVMYHSIHYMDAIRYLFGTPEFIYADGMTYPGQKVKGETRTMINMEYPGFKRGLIHDNHNNWATEDDWYATFRFEGTEGIIKGTNGALYNYPMGREDTLRFLSKKVDPNDWFSPILEGKWFPHAFMGTMGELMCAIEEDREPENSAEDNLKTLQMVFATYLSMKEKRRVEVAAL
ncbi:Gfo/Idh/MocA family oxidoreductase [Pullulanibacillus sp. KACC 23026]|uniref:Gfo/Idh/MocA family protein n=1 Tax=Pullulanibacillus sp. KACC 23026 TaxID=3028315 RepID=UPI0023AE9A2D|nr:Gfo/Idh/MocA family oxidoreductase [Pullulanibacillus sp. KACC 23026]WEG11727.1 Gfo/Idh/MocA family oxidoreductase [Pullulanibacillus sp. KACC 23026]